MQYHFIFFLFKVSGGSKVDAPTDVRVDFMNHGIVKVSWSKPNTDHVIVGYKLLYRSSGINCTTDELVSNLYYTNYPLKVQYSLVHALL